MYLLSPRIRLMSAGPESSCRGGMRLAWFNATWPLVRLVLMRNGIRLEPSIRFLRWMVPVWEVRYDELLEAQAVGNIPCSPSASAYAQQVDGLSSGP
jgi:hypothetical protein